MMDLSCTRWVGLHAEAGHLLCDALPLDDVLESISWGTKCFGDLCLNNMPVTISFLGQFVSAHIGPDPDGGPEFCVHVKLLCDYDQEGVHSLMGRSGFGWCTSLLHGLLPLSASILLQQ